MKIKLLFINLCIVLLLFNCSNDDDNNDDGFDGSIEDIRNFYNDDLVDALEDLGFNINTGNVPPNIEGSYILATPLLEASSVNGDNLGMSFDNYTLAFSNQNNGNLTVDFTGNQTNQTTLGSGSFISGDSNSFSVFLITTTTDESNDTSSDSAMSISGKLTSEGIIDIQLAIMMLDNNDNPKGNWIPNNTGRIVYDSDGFSPRQ